MHIIFTHIKNWGGVNRQETFLPVNGDEVVPHIYGHFEASDADTHFGTHKVVDWEEFDAYEVEEDSISYFNLLGNGYYVVPKGFRKMDEPKITAYPYYSTYCDMGCQDCGHEYPHLEFVQEPGSGVILVPKGSVITGIRKAKAGLSFFPDVFNVVEL